MEDLLDGILREKIFSKGEKRLSKSTETDGVASGKV